MAKKRAASRATGSDSTEGAAATETWRDLHLWQIQPVRDVIVVVGVIALFWLGSKLSVVTVPLLLAVMFAYLLEPVIVWLMRRFKLSRQGAAGSLLVALILVVVVPSILGAVFGAAQLTRFAGRTTTSVNDAIRSARDIDDPTLNARVENAGGPWVWIRDRWHEFDPDGSVQLEDVVNNILNAVNPSALVGTASAGANVLGSAAGMVGGTFGLAFAVFLTGFFFYFVATGWIELKAFSTKLLPDKHKGRIIHLTRKFDAVISGFVRGRLTIAFVQAFVFSIGYFLIGVPASFILGPVVAILSIVPYLAMVGIPISIALLWIEGHTGFRGEWWWVLGAPCAVYFLGQALDDYLLTPMIQGKSTNMDTPTILFATLAGGVLFGVFGMLIAIPLAACIKILIQELFWPRFKAWAEGREKDFLPIGEAKK